MTTHPYSTLSTLSAIFPMSQDELHEIAQATTPEAVQVPNTWAGLAVWALSKWGIGMIFLVMLVPVYQDMKASNQAQVEMMRASITALNALATEVRSNGETIQRIEARYQYEHKQ